MKWKNFKIGVRKTKLQDKTVFIKKWVDPDVVPLVQFKSQSGATFEIESGVHSIFLTQTPIVGDEVICEISSLSDDQIINKSGQ